MIKNKKINKNIVKLFVAGSMLIPAMTPITALANETKSSEATEITTVTKNLASYTVGYQDTDSVKSIIIDEFGEKANNLTYSETTEKDDNATLTYTSDDYQVDVSNLHLDSAGSQKVTMKMYTKNATSNKEITSLVQSPIKINADEAAMDSDSDNSALESGVITTKQSYVTVTDSKAPTIDGPNTLDVEQGNTIDIKSNYSASDDKDENVEIGLSGSVDFGQAGTYEMTVTAKDSSGNVSAKKISINVKEKSSSTTENSAEASATSTSSTTSGQATSFSQAIANAALAQVGASQDCTMLVTNSLKAVGISFHGWPYQYASLGSWTDNPVPGDIIIYDGHVAIYIGNGQAVHGGWLGVTTVVSSVQCTNALVGYIHVSQ